MNMTNKHKPYFKALSSLLAFLVSIAPLTLAWGLNWENATMAHGSAIGKTENNTTLIVQGSQNAIYNWGGSGFNLAQGEVLSLMNGKGFSLMHDTTGAGSSILGSIYATGNLMIANPAGILIGSTGEIDVGGQFHGIAGNVDQTAFDAWVNDPAAGYSIGLANGDLTVELGAKIKAGQNVVLVGNHVENYGTINSAGTIAILGAQGTASGAEQKVDDNGRMSGFFGTAVVAADNVKGGKITFSFGEGAVAGEIHNHGTIAHTAHDMVDVRGKAVEGGRITTDANGGIWGLTGKISDAGLTDDTTDVRSAAGDWTQALSEGNTIYYSDARAQGYDKFYQSVNGEYPHQADNTSGTSTEYDVSDGANQYFMTSGGQVYSPQGSIHHGDYVYSDKSWANCQYRYFASDKSVDSQGTFAGVEDQGVDSQSCLYLATMDTKTANAVNMGQVNLHSGEIDAKNLTIQTAKLSDTKYAGEGIDKHSVKVAHELSIDAAQVDLTHTQVDATGNTTGRIEADGDVLLGNIQYTGDVTAMGGDILIRKATEDVVVNAATAAAGNIEINSAGKVTASGTITAKDVAVTAAGDVAVQGVTASEGNVAIASTGGALTIGGNVTASQEDVAGKGLVTLTAKGDLTNGGSVTAAGEKAALTSTDGNIVKTGNVKASKEIEIAAKGNVFINGVIETEEAAADSGKVTITATEGAIYDTWVSRGDIEIKTGDLILSAGNFIGNSDSETAPVLNGMLEVEVATLDATAKNGIQIEEQDALDVKNAINSGVGDVKVTTGDAMTLVKESEVSTQEGNVELTATSGDLVMKGTTSADEQAARVIAKNGFVAMTAEGGSIRAGDKTTLEAGNYVEASKNVKMTAQDKIALYGATVKAQENALLLSGSDLTLDNAGVEAQKNVRMVNKTGAMTLDAATVRALEVVNMGGENDGTTIEMKASAVTAANGDVAVYAQSNITMDKNSVLKSEAADVAMKSGAGDVTVGQVFAEEGRAAIQAGENIVRADGSDTDNVTAKEVLLSAVDGNIGKQDTEGFTHYIHVSATDLQTASGKSQYLNATKALTVKDLAEVTKIDLVDGDGVVTKDVEQSFASDHALKAGEDIRLNVASTLTKVDGAQSGDETVTLVVADKVEAGTSETATGTIRIETESGSIAQNADIEADGDITIAAQEDIHQNANILTTVKGDVFAQAGRDHVMAADSVIAAADGDVSNSEKGSVLVDAGRDFHLEEIDADNHVAVTAGRDVIDIDHDAVLFNGKGEATNLNAADQKTDITVRNDRNLVINAGGNIGAAGEMNGATDGIDIAVNGKVSAEAGGSLALAQTANDTVSDGDLNIGDVAAFRVEQVEFSAADKAKDDADAIAGEDFAATREQVGITAGGTANLAAENWIVNDNASATETTEITAEKLVMTAGRGAGVNRAHGEDSLQVEVSGTGANAIWGNSTTASDRSVTMSMEDATGNRELFADGGAMEDSGVVLLMDGRYHGGDNLYYNHFAQVHALNQNRLPGAVFDLNIFNDSEFVYADKDAQDVPGAKFRKGVRPVARVKMTKRDSATGEETTVEPFVGSYNPEKAVADAAQ